MLVKSYFSALNRGATQKKNDHQAVTAIRSGGITSGNRKLAQGRDLSINSERNLKGIRKLSPHLGGELSGSGSIGGKIMHDTEVNKRAMEVEKELQEMKKQWVKMYELLTKLIDDTTIDNKYDE